MAFSAPAGAPGKRKVIDLRGADSGHRLVHRVRVAHALPRLEAAQGVGEVVLALVTKPRDLLAAGKIAAVANAAPMPLSGLAPARDALRSGVDAGGGSFEIASA